MFILKPSKKGFYAAALITLCLLLPLVAWSTKSFEVKAAENPTYIEPFVQAVLSVPQTTSQPHKRNTSVYPVPPDRIEAQRIVTYWLNYYGADSVLGNCIVYLESGYNALAKNGTSSAAGLYQFIRSTFNSTAARMDLPYTYETSVYDAEINARMGAWLLKTDGPTHWVVYKSCL